MMKECTPSTILHAYVDGILPEILIRRLDAHIPECSHCRDRVRALRRVECFLSRGEPRRGLEEEARALAAAARENARATSGPGEASRPRRGRRLAPVLLGAALVLLLISVLPSLLPRESAVVGVEAAPVGEGFAWAARLRQSDPALALSIEDYREIAEEWRTALPGGRSTSELHRILRMAFRGAATSEDRLRAGRLALALDVAEVRSAFAGWLGQASLAPAALRHGLVTLGALGGRDAVRFVREVARSQSVEAATLARTLGLTGDSRVAEQIWALVRDLHLDRSGAYLELHRLKGAAATRILVGEFVAGRDSPVLPRILAEREGAARLLRAALDRTGRRERMRILGLLGQLGDREAVPHLRRLLLDPTCARKAVAALESIIHGAAPEVVLVLVEHLPLLDEMADWRATPEASTLEDVFRELPAASIQVLAEELRGERAVPGRASVRQRRLLLAAALTGRGEMLSMLEAALADPATQRAALTVLALHGAGELVPLVAPFATSRQRSSRRLALRSLLELGGEGAVAVLEGALRRSSDRRFVIRHLDADPELWAAPVLIAALAHQDTSLTAREVLGRLAPAGAELPGLNASAWRRLFGLSADAR